MGVGLIATALVIVGLAELQRHQQQAARWVDHELEALNAVARFERDMDAAASEARGYLIDARPDRLQWFEAAARRVQGDLPDLRSVIAEDPAQQATLARLEPLVAARMDVLRYAIARQQAHDVDSMALLRRAQTGQEIMAQIFAATGDLRAEERRLLDRRSSGARHEARLMVLGLTISELLSAASGFVAWMLLVSRHREQRHLAEMRQLNLELEERVHARTAELRQLNAELEERVLARTAELAASEARQSAYLRHLADGLLVIRVEPDGRFVCESVNTAAAVMLGLDEAAGGEQREVALKAALGQMETYLRRSMAELGPMRYGSEAGGPRELRFVVAPVQDTPDADHPKGRVGLLLVSVRDMTYEAGLEAKLRSAQRMEAVGQLTTGVAHDFNNLLQAILGGLELLQTKPGLDAESRQCIAVGLSAAQRGATLTHRLLAFSRKQPLDPVLLDPRQVIAGMQALLCRTLRVRVESEVQDAIWPVHADAIQLDNCLLNLALNARDAMPGDGALRLGVANAGPADAEAASLPAGDYVCFRVEDHGTGMSPETLERALDPFFTTKSIGKGTGLGLSMVQGFARQSGGDVRIDSVAGRGTTVCLWLPRASAPVPAGAPAATQDQSDHAAGRVLLVDDEPGVRQVVSLFLSSGGFKPTAVDSGAAALDLLRAGEPYSLLVTDQSMPGMTGSELLAEVARLRPALPTMMITGHDRAPGPGQVQGLTTVLRKPIAREPFLRQVRALAGVKATASAGGPRPEGAARELRSTAVF